MAHQKALIQHAAATDSRLQFELDTVAEPGGPARLQLLFLHGQSGTPSRVTIKTEITAPGSTLVALQSDACRIREWKSRAELQFCLFRLQPKDKAPAALGHLQAMAPLLQAMFVVGINGLDLHCLEPFLRRNWDSVGVFPADAVEKLQSTLFLKVAYPLPAGSATPITSLHMSEHLLAVIGATLLMLAVAMLCDSGTCMVQ